MCDKQTRVIYDKAEFGLFADYFAVFSPIHEGVMGVWLYAQCTSFTEIIAARARDAAPAFRVGGGGDDEVADAEIGF